MQFNKKAQVGETMTWVVATVIIIILSIVFLFCVNALSKSKGTFLGVPVLSAEEAIAPKQQMLFAILTKEPDLSMENIKKILDDFKSQGVNCDFISGEGAIYNDGQGEWIDIKMKDKEVITSLRC